MNKKTTLALAGLIGLALSGMAGAADVHTKTIASTCMTCHGPGGHSKGAIPSLAGLEKDYFVNAMKEFKSGARPGTIMKRHAAGYTDAEYEAMGAYFASLK
jgi:cytochrome c553